MEHSDHGPRQAGAREPDLPCFFGQCEDGHRQHSRYTCSLSYFCSKLAVTSIVTLAHINPERSLQNRALFVGSFLVNLISFLKKRSSNMCVIGNKGAVGVSFMFNGTSFGFVNSHLTSGSEKKLRYGFHSGDI